jgi:hypothetical protein
MACSSHNGLTNGKWNQQHQAAIRCTKKDNKVVNMFVHNTRETSSGLRHAWCPSKLAKKETCTWITTRDARDYRNGLCLPEVDAGTACRRGTAVTSLRQWAEESSAYWTESLWRWSMKTSKLTSSVNITSPPGAAAFSELYVTDGLSFASKNRACRFRGK